MSITAPSQREGSAILSARRDEFSEEIISAYRSCSWAELALRRQGWTPERLQKASHKAANDYVAMNVPYLAQDRRDDLADFLVEKALVAVLQFRPTHPTQTYGKNGGSHFDSWIYDLLMKRCIDWFRSKASGNGDRRYGNDNRIVLDDDPDPADHDMEFDNLVDDRRRAKWQQAATDLGFTEKKWGLSEWIVITLDKAAADVLRSAA